MIKVSGYAIDSCMNLVHTAKCYIAHDQYIAYVHMHGKLYMFTLIIVT